MNLADCYRLLGLRSGASYEEIKASYRRLARQYHPDVNPGQQQQANEKFIQIAEAYRQLVSAMQPPPDPTPKSSSRGDRPQKVTNVTRVESKPQPSRSRPQQNPAPQQTNPQVKITRKPSIQRDPDLPATDYEMKQRSYEQLQYLLKDQRFPRAIALVEGLAERFPNDGEIRQWMAIAYQRWGRYLVDNKQPEKARIYLKKALRTDPHNKSLWYEVERDFRRIEQIEIY